ncbi:hypothetical protein B5800_11960 [Gilliamella apicola]|uniref:hypothetical protein n=2 Tax=Gilliamella apicola TaxID=1196095 RepID=UPI0009FBBB8D|nr:hypothetical protein [Gilliamella apicola]ORF44353.1 hypothetical protein B5800_11960 [Gilliamella apicola]ORF48391.1 hypothetical protein B5799_09020 [Gilliamella apicola]ORF55348.1 hypothetical protein B5798_04290 [Gilliamella apicola]ORF59286.1 hypothetical protein B5801_07685 [Gilliamella apicola]ORF61481.1 hypothetical protein B5804_03380 [Gilliamella apicola]
MKKILLLLLLITISMVCRAKEPCTNKTFVENYQFNINTQPYKFTSYLCEDKDKDEDDDVFLTPGILEIHGKNFNKTYKNVIGMAGHRASMFTQWNDKHKPVFFYSLKDIIAHIPIIIKDNNLMVNCIYINKSLENSIELNYSHCGNLQIIEDGFGEEGFDKLLRDFYLEAIYYFSNFTENKESLQYKKFDVFIGKIDGISFYRRYSSIKDYKLNKYTVVMVNKGKEYRFKPEDEVYQRIVDRSGSQAIIGLDIVDSKGNIKFYNKKALSALLNKSTIKRNITSYIQYNEKTKLYNKPSHRSATDMYLVQHDSVTILDEILYKGNSLVIWYKISYNSKKHGKIIKWIKEESFDSKLND